MNRLGKSLVLILVISAITQLNLAKAQPSMVNTGITIYSPNYIPYQNEQYENTTATLNIKVTLVYAEYNQSWLDTVHLDSVCYSLDGQPLSYIDEFAVENYTDYGINQQDFLVYTASIKLENLSKGSHAITAYANDTHNEYAYLNTLSAKYGFIVKNDSDETPSPSVPEVPVLAIAPLLISILVIAVIIRHQKNVSLPPWKKIHQCLGRTKWMSKQNRSILIFTPLLVVLIAASFFGVFLLPVASQTTADRTPDRIVSNEMQLRNAVNSALGPLVIALDNDITLTEQLVIPANKDITLTSTPKLFKLIGEDRELIRNEDGILLAYPDAVINVEGSGVLKIDGIVVTCENYALAWNKLVHVDVCGTLILYSGEISGNSLGDGVVNGGTFEMCGGKISNNTSIVGRGGHGGAVYNSEYGKFSMFGGEISNNTGFGVINRGTNNWGWRYGTFNMLGGLISNNIGGGVQNSAIFSMSGGEISNNIGGDVEQTCGGVSNSGDFSMTGGVVSNNQATHGGGVYNYPDGNFSLSENGAISGNKAEVGGGVYNAGNFNRRGGVISGNTATQYSDIYPNDDSPLPTSSIIASPSPTSPMQTSNTGAHMPETEPFPTSVLIVALILLAVATSALLFRRQRKNATIPPRNDRS